MGEHLKPREYYEDLYDKFTVERCRRFKNRSHDQEIEDSDFGDVEKTPHNIEVMKEIKTNWGWLVSDMLVWGNAAYRFNTKAATIEEWEQRDREHDERVAKLTPPEHVRCRECLSTDLRLTMSEEYWRPDGKKERMLYMYTCRKCDTKTPYFDNGEQFEVGETLCPKCQRPKPKFTRSEVGYITTINHFCPTCRHEWSEEIDLTPSEREDESDDPTYLEDRKLYCYSDKVREWAKSAQELRPKLDHMFPTERETEEAQRLKELLAKVRKVTVAQVAEQLEKVLLNAGYTNLQLGQPEMAKDVTVPFNLIDGKDRIEHKSQAELYKLMTDNLEDTNWRLVRSSLNYRMGYLTGKLKGYESQEDLRIILEKKVKK
jgi:ribosomal protein L40E